MRYLVSDINTGTWKVPEDIYNRLREGAEENIWIKER
jgi:hypothetical protein